MMTLVIVAVVILIPIFIVIGIYNKLVTQRNRFKNAFSQIDVQMKRRHDLIPNLVEIAKGYMKHEREALEAVIAARSGASSALKKASSHPEDGGAIHALAGAEGALTGSLGRLFALAEAYPDLKANQNMLSLQEELSSTENKISFARQAFNDSVTEYNNSREVFPNNFISGIFNFAPAELFEIENPQEKAVPKISFS